MRIRFTPSARVQFLGAVAYIRRDKPAAATRFRRRVETVLRQLEKFPQSGRRIPEFPDLPHRPCTSSRSRRSRAVNAALCESSRQSVSGFGRGRVSDSGGLSPWTLPPPRPRFGSTTRGPASWTASILYQRNRPPPRSPAASTQAPATAFARSSCPAGGWSTVSRPPRAVRRSSASSWVAKRGTSSNSTRPLFTRGRKSM